MITPKCSGIIEIDGSLRNLITANLTVKQDFEGRVMYTHFSPMKYTYESNEESYMEALIDMRLDLEDNMEYMGMKDKEIEESIKLHFPMF